DFHVTGVQTCALPISNNYGISNVAANLVKELQSFNTATFVFGNSLAISNFCEAGTLVVAYQDDDITRHAAADLVAGKILSKGTLPVSVCDFKFGEGMVHADIKPVRAKISPQSFEAVDSIVKDAIDKKAFPGAVVMAVHQGKIVYHKAFGNYCYEESTPDVTRESIFDLASVTKVSATTLAVMKLYEEKRLDLNKTLGDYLPM